MTRMTAKDFDQELLELYDDYAHGMITKRQFLDRAAKCAIGGVTAVGGYPGNDAEGRAFQQTVDPEKLMNDFFAGAEWLMSMAGTNGKAGCVGFSYGGGLCNALAVAYPELAASVPFHGRQAAPEDAAKIEAALLLHYAELIRG